MTIDEIKAAGIEAVEQRMDEIRALVDTAGEAALDEIGSEVDALAARKAELKEQAEARAAIVKTVTEGAGEVKKNFEEEKRMSYGIETAEYRSAWLKNLMGKEVSAEERTALANGAYVIPTETLNRIVGKMELYPLLNAIDVLHIPGYVSIPVEGTVNEADVVAMGTAATDSEDAMAQVTLSAYKFIKTLEITADVTAMAVPAFETWLVERLANKIFRHVTDMVASGTGSSEPYGLTTITATDQTYTKAAITFTDLLTIIAKLPTRYLPGASFVMSRATFWTNVMAVKDSQNNPIVVADRQAPAKYNVMGYPVIIEDEVGTDIIFGDLKEGYIFNFAKEVEVARDESVGFRTGSTVFRGMCLGDGKPTGVGLVRYTKAT